MRYLTTTVFTLACGLCLCSGARAQMPAPSQDPQAMMKMMHLAAQNQLGVLEYCEANGSVGSDVVDLQKRMIGMLPPAQVDGLDAAEDSGKKGIISVGGQQMVLADSAKAQGTTPDAMCKQMGTMLKTQAANMPK